MPTAELPWYRITWDLNRDEHDAAAFDEHAPLVEELLDRIRPGEARSPRPMSSRGRDRVVLAADQPGPGDPRRRWRRRGSLGWPGARGTAVSTTSWNGSSAPNSSRSGCRRETSAVTSSCRATARTASSVARGVPSSGSGRRPGCARPDRPDLPTRGELLEELVEAGTLTPVTVEGVRGDRFVLAEEIDLLEAAADGSDGPDGHDDRETGAGVALLAPLDPFVWDRDLLRSLYGFDYVWEVYVPAAKRRWGYYVLPILFGDRIVGRIEPRIDRRAGVVRVLDAWWEDWFDPVTAPGFVDALSDALAAHARFAEVGRIVLPRTARHRALARAIRDRLGSSGRIRG